LTLFVVPASVEVIDSCCFHACVLLWDLTFSSPSHLRELLDLPPLWPGMHEIPDSVERLAFSVEFRRVRHVYTLSFGRDSALREIAAGQRPWSTPGRSFLQVSSHSVKVIRSALEFASEEEQPRFPKGMFWG
jgi:hypothetical protein